MQLHPNQSQTRVQQCQAQIQTSGTLNLLGSWSHFISLALPSKAYTSHFRGSGGSSLELPLSLV